MLNFRPILEVIGVLLVILAIVMLGPLVADAVTHNHDWRTFAISSFLTSFIGGTLIFTNHGHRHTLTIRDAFFLTALAWLVLPAFGAFPFLFAYKGMGYTDAFFEAMSGITSCGASVITGLDHAPAGILLWRALLNWIGGIGIIVVAMAVLPMLKVGGMQLFKMESSDKSEKILPSATQFAAATAGVYAVMTFGCAVCLYWAGMSAFDAMCHAMTAMATGGFANYDNSIGHFNNLKIELILIVTMILSCLPFVLYIQMARGHVRPFFKDTQALTFLGMLGVAIIAVTYWLQIKNALPFPQALRYAAFNVTSIMTTTGFSSTNYALWGTFPTFILLFASLIGGCTGSTAGAIKIFRFQVLWEIFKVQMRQLVHPSGIFKMRFNDKPISEGVAGSVLLFFFIYISVFVVSSLLLCATDLDWVTSTSAAASAMAAAGYGLGDIISPAGSFEPLSDFAKWVLSALMMMGRLEFLTVLVLFSPSFWRG